MDSVYWKEKLIHIIEHGNDFDYRAIYEKLSEYKIEEPEDEELKNEEVTPNFEFTNCRHIKIILGSNETKTKNI